MIFIYTFKRINRGFNYYFEKVLYSGEQIDIKLPDVSFSKMKISEIGFQADSGISLGATLSETVDDAKWVEINNGDFINKTVNIIRASSTEDNQRLILRVIMC